MKIWSVFSLVIFFHFVVIGLLFIQPGCQSAPRQSQDPGITQPSGRDPAPQPLPAESGQLDPAFNAGIQNTATSSGSRSLSAPRRPEGSAAAGPDTGLLEPVRDPVADSFTLPPVERQYTVQRGDTLSGIARREGVSLSKLLSANGLDKSSTIYVGQNLLIPETGPAEDAASREIEHSGEEVTVRRGDTLSAIASRNGTTVKVLKSLNNLRGDTIYVGQKLRVPSGSGQGGAAPRRNTSATPLASSGTSYTVQAGDTVSGIARRFGTTTSELMAVNNIDDPRRLYVGRTLVLPEGSSNAGTALRETQASQRQPVLQAPNRPSRETPATEPEPAPGTTAEEDPMSALEALEDDDLPFVEVEAVEEESDPEN